MQARRDVIALSGVAGAGKSTTCKILSAMIGYSCVEVEAKECWYIEDPVLRQNCFLEAFTAEIARSIARSNVVLSNSLLTVAAYSIAMSARQVFAEAIYRYTLIEANTRTIVLTAPLDVIEERISKRLTEDPGRKVNVIERNVSESVKLHAHANHALVNLARALDIPVVRSDDDPYSVAARAARLLGF